MIKNLKLQNVGPASRMELNFGSRLNVITGDNGLGKSFILDAIWLMIASKWPAELNPALTSGRKAIPQILQNAKISISALGKSNPEYNRTAHFEPEAQSWKFDRGRPGAPALLIYAMSDGSFAVWDPIRNYWSSPEVDASEKRFTAYVFSANEIWNGLPSDEHGGTPCNGLIRDWTSWQGEKNERFDMLMNVLAKLSPSENELLKAGKPTKIDPNDARKIPTVIMPYGQEVPVIHCSSGIRRILSMAYLMVWAWSEHKDSEKLYGKDSADRIIFLIDEIEAHLHPSWQRKIIPALFVAASQLSKDVGTQIILSTHSPLVMASIEPLFMQQTDAWFDIDLNGRDVQLASREFIKYGSSDSWLRGQAFDLQSTRSIEAEKVINEANLLMQKSDLSKKEVKDMTEKLTSILSQEDSYMSRWIYVCTAKGLM